jgi:hypothetical protein
MTLVGYTVKRYAPPIGSIVTIGKSKVELLVVESWNEVSEDTQRGDSYSADMFKTIAMPIYSNGVAAPAISPKEKTWTMDGWSMGGPNMVKAEDITIIGTANVKKEVTVRYLVTKAKRR